jgi:hypothetical protein
VIETHERVADLDLIAVVEHDGVGTLPIDQAAVARAQILEAPALALHHDRDVSSRDRDVGEHDVLIGTSTDSRLGTIEAVLLPAVVPADDVQDRCAGHVRGHAIIGT